MDAQEMVRVDNSANMLALVDTGRVALMEARDDFARLRVRDKAKAIYVAAEVLKRKDIQTHASILVQEAERAIVKANPPMDPKRSGSMSKSKGVVTRAIPSIKPYVLSKMRAVHGKLSDEEYDQLVQAAYKKQEPLTRKSLGRAHRFESNSGRYEWYTPGWVIELARDVLGEIDLDPLSCGYANETVRAAKYYTRAEDGFQHEWTGRLWLNPPFTAKTMAAVVDKLLQSPGVDAGLMLANNSLETKWCQRMLAFSKAHCLLGKRVAFDKHPDDTHHDSASPLVGQIIVAFGEGLNVRRFMEAFERVGYCGLNTQGDWRGVLDWRESMALEEAA